MQPIIRHFISFDYVNKVIKKLLIAKFHLDRQEHRQLLCCNNQVACFHTRTLTARMTLLRCNTIATPTQRYSWLGSNLIKHNREINKIENLMLTWLFLKWQS